jgi:hypothetical protein
MPGTPVGLGGAVAVVAGPLSTPIGCGGDVAVEAGGGGVVVAAGALLDGTGTTVVDAPAVDDVVVDPLAHAASTSTAPRPTRIARHRARADARRTTPRAARACGSARGVIGRRA